MAIELDLQIHNKKRIAIMSGIMIALSIYTLSDISNQPSLEPYTAATSTNTPINESTEEIAAAATNTGEMQLVGINPFIELKEFDPTVQNISDMTNTNSYENSSTTGTRPKPNNIPLPAIPNYNGHINYQERPQSIPASAIAIKPEQPTVQGIGIGNSGNNIAILSDGRVVSEGDTYNDGRIAYIGGDGITFDNGEKLQYK